MRKKLKVKLFKVKAFSPNVEVKVIVVGFNNKVNGSRCERIGVFYVEHDVKITLINLYRLAYWLNRGNIKIKSKVSEVIGLLGQVEYESILLKNQNKLNKTNVK